MSGYYIDEHGKIKKRKNKVVARIDEKGTITPITPPSKKEDEDIAPVKQEKRTWFKKSEGNIGQTILGSANDVNKNWWEVIIGAPEKIGKGLISLGATMNEQQQRENLNNQLMFGAVKGKSEEELDKMITNTQKDIDTVYDESSKLIVDDWYDEEKATEKFIEYSPIGALAKATGTNKEEYSVFGERTDGLVQSASQLVLTSVLNPVIPWWVTTGAMSFGGEVESAMQQGATFHQAQASGLITAGAEILTEKLSGGIKFGGRALDDITIKPLLNKISNKAVRTLANYGVDVVGEGLEEVASGVISNLGTALYKEENLDEILFSEEALDGYIESFIGGMVLSGGANAGRVANSIKTGRDYSTGLTENEQGMIDSLTDKKAKESTKQRAIEKEVEKAIAERETSQGGTLSEANKEALKQSIMSKIDNGEIDISSYELSEKERLQIQEEAQEELKSGKFSLSELEDLATTETTSKIKDLETQLENAKTKEDQTRIENELEKLRADRIAELQGKAKQNMFLGKAVHEKMQEYTNYTYDKAKVKDTFEQETRDSATTHANNTEKTRRFVDSLSKLAKAKQTSIRITNNQELLEQGDLVKKDKLTTEEQAQLTKLEKQLANARTDQQKQDIQNQIVELTYMDNGGLVRTDANGKKTILVNIDSKQAMYEVVGHETRHMLEADNDINKTYNEKLFAYAESQGDLEALRQTIKDTYNTEDVDLINSELSAKLTGKYLFENPKFLESIIKDSDQSTAQKIVSKIKEVIDDLIVHFKGTEQEKQLREIQKTFKEMYKQYSADTNTNTGEKVQYALSEYTEQQENAILKGDKREVLRSSEDVRNFAERTLLNNEYETFGYMGVVPSDVVNRIKNEVTEISTENRENLFKRDAFSLRIRQSEIVHLKKIGMTIEDAVDYVSKVPQIVTEFDTVRYAVEYKDGKRIEGLRFSKTFPDGKMYNYLMISNRKGTMTVKTSYMSKDDYMKKGKKNEPSLVVDTEIAPTNTSETGSSSAFDNSVPNSDKKSTEKSQQDNKHEVPLEERLSGDDLLDAQDLITEIQDVSEISPNGYITLYHRTTKESADKIRNTKKMSAREDGVFFSSKEQGQNNIGYGDDVVKLKVPIENVVLDDIFSDEASLRIPLKNKNATLDISQYLIENDAQMSLTDNNQDIAPVGNRLQDLRVKRDIAPVREDHSGEVTEMVGNAPSIAPSVTEQTVQEEMYAPVTEEEAHAMLDSEENWERLRSLQEAEEPQEIDAPIYTPSEIKVESPFESRDIQEVGNRKEKAYMYENPEVKPFFQEEAGRMLTELKNSIKGERHYNDQLYYESGGELGFYGTKRYTSDDIAYYLDNFKYTYAQIEQGLKDIIEDNGKENNAVSKRLEFAINDRLQYGYNDFMTGYNVEPNQDYVNLLADKQINTYSDEAFEMWARSLEHAEPPTEVFDAPIRETVETTPIETELDTTDSRQLAYDMETGELVEEDMPTRTRKEIQQALLQEGNVEFAKSLDNAKNIPMALMNNTDTIRVTEMVFGRENGRKINDLIFQKTIDNEAKSTRWQNQERADIKKLGIKARSKMSEAVQKYGEGEYVNEKGDKIAYDDLALASDFPNQSDQQRIKEASQVLRQKYDQYIELANKVLTDLGFDAIPKRKDYFRHFQELNDIFTQYGLPFNPQNMAEHVLPTDINGLTDTWSPQKNYFANAQPRMGIKTTYDAIGGIDGYISGISNLIFHTEDIQRGRAFENLIRETYGRESGLENFDNMTPEEQQVRIKKIHDKHLSGYASWVHEWTNNIAGKKSKVDRSVEALFDRKALSVLDEIRKQVGSNLIGFNVSSSLTNGIASIQAMAKTNKLAVLKGTADTIKNIFIKDTFMDKNDFLTNRMGTEMLSKKPWEKMRDAGFVFMKGMDWFTANQIVRSKYHELRAKGLSETRAHAEAGQFASRVMADRTKGAMPQLYNSKLFGVVTQFQLEVNNQLYSMFYDTYHESKESAKGKALMTSAKMTFTLGQLMAYTHVFGKTFESLAGYNPTFDIIGIIATALGVGDDDEEKTTSERLQEASDKLLDSLPYVSFFAGGGRFPIESGIPNLIGVATGETDEYGNPLTFKDEMSKLLNLVPPTGGNQIKKTTQGLAMFDEDHPISGSYTDSGNLRFPVEDTLANRVQAGLFGQWANKNAGEYFDRDIAPLKPKQIQEYKDLDLPISDYWDIRKGLAKQDKVDEKFDYIASLDLPISKKNILINNAVKRKEEIDLTGYENHSSYEEFDFAVKNPGEYAMSKVVGDYNTYKAYTKALGNIEATKNAKGESINGSRKKKVLTYINNLNTDYYTKIMLYKKEYQSDDTYNMEIIDYLNERDDITFKERVDILKELGFEVLTDGTVRW